MAGKSYSKKQLIRQHKDFLEKSRATLGELTLKEINAKTPSEKKRYTERLERLRAKINRKNALYEQYLKESCRPGSATFQKQLGQLIIKAGIYHWDGAVLLGALLSLRDASEDRREAWKKSAQDLYDRNFEEILNSSENPDGEDPEKSGDPDLVPGYAGA
ncbi:MAG: conjugal transfer protein TraD [Lachnospiraceae bacterium]|nr:conjugal transfer protein TraD [Lachnospiraceae bacterium]